ncbi:NHL repeat-containing protein [Baekduia alba]|uniref:NHL repeat-containing protein n=1 Tax=Baekduia alba TaxID=2997333 RepID=UPI0023426D9E|nr:NHL repeat-containing protein [Baekduia alba]
MLVLATYADAATPGTSYGFQASFGSADLVANGQPVSTGIAVEPGTGNLIVADEYGVRAQVFAPDVTLGGTFLTTLNSGSLSMYAAVDPTDGTVYVSDAFGGGVAKFTSDGAPVPTYTSDPSFAVDPAISEWTGGGMAVDGTTHDLLISDPSVGRVFRFSASGTLLSSFNGSDSDHGTFRHPRNIAVSPGGTTYVVDDRTPLLDSTVELFDSSGVAQGSLPITGGPQGVAVDPATGAVVVVEDIGTANAKLEGFTSTGVPTFTVHLPATATGANHGLAIDPATGRIYLQTDDGTTSQVFMFRTGVQAGLDAPVVSNIETTSVHVRGVVAPGGESTTARLEYCPASTDCASFPMSDPNDPANPWQRGPDHPGLTSNGEEAIEDDFTGLQPNAAYLVRSYAENSLTNNTSATTSFSTAVVPPAVTTGAAKEITQASAMLYGLIDTIGDQTTYHFEYGTTTEYGTSAPQGAEAIAGKGRTPRTFSRPISGLRPGTTYHYRLVARNSAGVAAGADATFTTDPADSPNPHLGYEQVTPVDKLGASLNTTFGFQAKADGTAIEYMTASAPSNAPSAAQFTRFFSMRGAADWDPWVALDPPLNVGRETASSVTLAVSKDFTHTMVVSNRKLADGGTEGVGNLYAVDVKSRAYTFVGSSNVPSAYNVMSGINRANMFIAGASDFSWLVFASQVPLLPGVPSRALYRWDAGRGLQLESKLPSGAVPTSGIAIQGVSGAQRMVADDGSRMYFTLDGADGGVYVRTTSGTTAVSVSHILGGPATPQAALLSGVSRDGRYAVFTSGRLTSDAPTVTDLRNIYQYDAVTNELRFIGTIPANPEPFYVMAVSDDGQTVYFDDGTNTVVWRGGVLQTVSSAHPGPGVFASPSGRYLAYGGSGSEVYLYDADADLLTCVSCPPGGGSGVDASLPIVDRNVSNRIPQPLTDDGELFFDTPTSLITRDNNGARDVYAYRDGKTTLISPGTGQFAARFADASTSGDDIFFTTAESLVGQDQDQADDVYDARLGGGFPGQSPAPRAACAKSECVEPTPGPVSSAPAPGPAQSAASTKSRTNQTKARVSVATVSFTSKAMHITVRVSQRGRVRVSGSRLTSTVRNAAKAGSYRLVVPLSKKARSLRRAHRSFKVSARISLAGGWGTSVSKISRTLGK